MLQDLGWFSNLTDKLGITHHKKEEAPAVTTSAGTNLLSDQADTHVATLTNVNGSDLKVVSTNAGNTTVDKLVNNGSTTFTTPSNETSAPSAPVAVIVDKTTNQPVAVVETK